MQKIHFFRMVPRAFPSGIIGIYHCEGLRLDEVAVYFAIEVVGKNVIGLALDVDYDDGFSELLREALFCTVSVAVLHSM